MNPNPFEPGTSEHDEWQRQEEAAHGTGGTLPPGPDEEHTCQHGEANPCPQGCPEPEAARAARLMSAVRDGAWLDAQTFPELRWAVPGVLPEGFTLLVGAPKVGKSWLALAWLLAAACGGRALGHIAVPKGPVLYLALEDGHRRMQDRCRAIMEDEALPGLYHYVIRVTPAEVLATIETFLAEHPDTVMVVIDTLGKVMPPAAQGETTYQRDYRVGGRLKAISDARPGLALVVVHHDRKADSVDFVERVSGTNGLAGSADTIIVLSRQRNSFSGELCVTGRDVDEGEYAVVMTEGMWTLDGRDLDEAAQKALQRKVAEGVGDTLGDVIRVVGEHPEGVGPSEIAEALDMDPKAVRAYLSKALKSGRIDRLKRGLYIPLRVATVAMESLDSMPGDGVSQPTHSSGVVSGAMQSPDSMHGNTCNTQPHLGGPEEDDGPPHEPSPECQICEQRLLTDTGIERGVCVRCQPVPAPRPDARQAS